MSSNTSSDYLEMGPGGPVEPTARKSGGRRLAVLGGGAAVLALTAGGVWAWNFWFSQGPQPSEALPASTLAYVAIDLDPTGEQKVEAVETLKQFPGFEEEFGFDLGTTDDVKKWIFEQIQGEEGICEGVDYGDDVEPWLGDRFAFAVVDRGDEPVPVVVAHVTDEGDAADGLQTLIDCAGDGGAGFAVEGDWAVLAETEAIATDVLEAGQDDALSEDADYKKWTEAVGDPGFLTLYAAPEAGNAMLDFADEVLGGLWFGSSGVDCAVAVAPESTSLDEGSVDYTEYEDYYSDIDCGGGDEPAQTAMPESYRKFFEEFSGAAGTMRFEDGDVEIEFATGETEFSNTALLSDGGADVVNSLPGSTAAAFGAALNDGWVDVLLDQVGLVLGDEMSSDEALEMLEQETGITRADLESLDGASFALAFDSEVDANAFENEDITRVPVGLKIKGDTSAIESLLTKIRTSAQGDLNELTWETDGDYVLVSFNPAYIDVLGDGGDLGGNNAFEDLAPDAEDARAVLFVNFDANNWLDDLLADLGAPEEVTENVAPLQGLGVSLWVEDGEEHALLKLTTD